MSKQKLLFIVGLLIAGVVTAGVVFYLQTRDASGGQNSPLDLITRSDAEILYEDESGFSFKHFESASVSDTTPDEETYYTQLSLEKDGQKMTITMQDTKHKTIDAWLEKDENAPAEPSLVGAVSLDGVSARQYTQNGKLWTVAIDTVGQAKVLYLVEGQKDGDFWEKLHDLFVSTFAFEKEEEEETKAAPVDNTIYESEEIIE
ncbi:hypothetical protein CMO96_04865 [Candidatus Woesebacteria bacterium]|nr:hypothetical protein [Candidatus Woesebacteria bacterium]|tara:strand:- start:888 stop:1496 length:609 start_codon:yes stop_codon:yes gene_type:complete